MFSQGVIPSGAQQSRGTPLKNSSFCDGMESLASPRKLSWLRCSFDFVPLRFTLLRMTG